MSTSSVMPVVVAYKSLGWIESCIHGFVEHVPELSPLVVDNNPVAGEPHWEPVVEQERAWLQTEPGVRLTRPLHRCSRPDSPPASHGHALDHAVAWCREHGVEIMVLFEPDCIIRGRAWLDALVEAIEDGAWMAAPLATGFGPLKPCPSAWRVDRIARSFGPMRAPRDHPRYAELVDDDALRLRVEEQMWQEFWSEHWDTGFGNWFHAALAGRAQHLDPEHGVPERLTSRLRWKGIEHVGGGSTDNRRSRVADARRTSTA